MPLSAGAAAKTLRALRAAARERLSQAGIQNAAQEADWLLCRASGLSAAALLAHQDSPLDEAAQKRLELELRRRESGEPIQYILGSAPFRDLELEVGPGVLVPRPETELLVDLALSLLPDDGFVFMDWGTGSGCIAASILLERPRAFGFLAERNPKALSCAWRNLRRLGLLGRALLIHSRTPGDLPVGAECDLVVSNPPYIPTEAVGGLMRDVRDFEPRMALDGGADGMDCYRALFGAAPLWLKPGGLLLLEMGDAHQAERMKGHSSKFDLLRSVLDFSAIPRCMAWRYRG